MQRSWDDVRLFLALCRSRTVGEAGKALGVDSSTVSRRLVALEEELSATLFDRGRDGIAPTKSAEDLMPVAEEIEQAMRRFTNAAEGLEREISGVVRVTCPPDVGTVIIAPLVRQLVEKYPGLRIELTPSESVLDLTRREADIALRTLRPTHGDLVITTLARARWVVAAKDARALRDWTDAPWMGWGERLAHIPPARWFGKHVKSEPVVTSDSLMVHLSVIATGAAIGLVPEPSLAHYGLSAVKLHKRLKAASDELPIDELYLVTHRALRDVPRVRAVWNLLLGATRADTLRA